MIAILSFGFVLLFLGGVPIVFAMLAAAIGALSFGDSMPIELVAQRVVNGLDNFTFLAIPMFVLAGTIMEAFKPGTAPPDSYVAGDGGGGGGGGDAADKAVGSGTGGLY